MQGCELNETRNSLDRSGPEFLDPWGRLRALLSPREEHHRLAMDLVEQWKDKKYWGGVLEELLEIPLEAAVLFYCTLEAEGTGVRWSLSGHSDWMESYSFVNIRALGRQGRFGTFLDGIRILPSIRSRCIHLAPFTPYEHNCLYAVSSVRSISSHVTDLDLEAWGFNREWQLSALVRACHLLEKAAGFDLEPHFTTFSLPVMENPRLFRWIRLNREKTALHHGSMDKVLQEDNQELIAQEVEALVEAVLHSSGQPTLEYRNEEERKIREPLHHRLIGELISRGLWTIPSQYWAGEGVPEFDTMHPRGYPLFACRDREGRDQRDKALNVVTPLRFDRNGTLFAEIFPWWRDRFGFDFVRFDSADHIFDSSDGWDHRRSDRPSPRDLKLAVDLAREGYPGIGALAERMGLEYADYAACGFDAILGVDMFRKMGPSLVEKTLSFNRDLEEWNRRRLREGLLPVTVTWAVDTHDTGDANLLGAPLTESCTSKGLLQRQFMARFSSAGPGRRTKYEVVGCLDRSYGLFRSNVTLDNLTFRGDRSHAEEYHRLEDAYQQFCELLDSGTLGPSQVHPSGAWWEIKSPRGNLVCGLAFEGSPGLECPFSLVEGILLPRVRSLPQGTRHLPPGTCFLGYRAIEG